MDEKLTYEINGDFGSVRLCRKCIPMPEFQTPFSFLGGGWHHCRDLYHIQRPGGLYGYLLFFSVSEGGRIRIKNDTCKVPANSVSIIPPWTEHEYYTEKNQWWEFYWIHIGEECGEILKNVTERRGYIFESRQIKKINDLVEELFAERFMTDEVSYEIKASLIISQIVHILLEETYRMESVGNRSDECVSKMLREIEIHYGEELNISEMASRYYMSVQHMIRLFKVKTGYTPYAYLKKYRLQKAGELLMYSNLSVSEISDRTGFQGVNNFIYQFKQEFGMTPKRYKELHRV